MKWIRFTLDTHTDAVDMLSYMLDEIGVEGIEIEDHLPLSEEDKKKMFVDILPDPEDNDGTAKVHFYMEPENCDPEKVMIQVQNIFQEIKPFCEIGKGTISLSETEDKDWINNWKTFFKPFRAADDIVIKPTWEEYKKEKDSDILIEIDPGIAFGTGSHETTKLCIQALDKYVKNGDSVLDVGCGSGILSIAALKLGAKHATAIDIDEVAVKDAAENMAVNYNTASYSVFRLYPLRWRFNFQRFFEGESRNRSRHRNSKYSCRRHHPAHRRCKTSPKKRRSLHYIRHY